jgi:2-polyprenyl-6-methoxyphenol hydroxylase-like FAD-dependent oxidoreductase
VARFDALRYGFDRHKEAHFLADAEAIVVGGGIGGLSAALALRRAGRRVTVLEAADEMQVVGGGMQIWVNGAIALEKLGVLDRLLEVGGAIEQRKVFRSWRGQTLMTIPVGELAVKHGVPLPFSMQRTDLVRTLLDALPAGTVRLGAECVGFEQDAGGVTARLADGSEERAAVLVGVDGIDSRIRQTLHPGARPRWAGYQYLRALVEFETEHDDEFVFTMGRGDRFGAHDVGSGRVYWFGVITAPPGADGPRKQQLLERFVSFPPPVMAMIGAASEEEIVRTDIRDLKPLKRWGEGRVTLLGDAAHAATPNLGRGCCEAIEDAVELATWLKPPLDLDDGPATAAALRGYEEERRPQTAKVQRMAWRIGKVVSLRGRATCKTREALMRTMATRGMTKETEREFEELARHRRA